MAVSLGDLFSRFVPSGASAGSMVWTMLWIIAVSVLVIGLVIFIRNRLKYQYYGIVLKRRQESFEGMPQAMLVQGKAGYFKKKTGKTIFRIKHGFMPWQRVETSQLPDPKHMVGNMVVLLQLQKDNYAQAKIDIDWEGKTFTLEPIDDSLKYDAKLELSEIDNVLQTKKMSPVTVGILIIGLIIVAGIIVYYFLGKA